MHQFHSYTEFLVQVLGHVLGRINRTVLATGASEAHRKVAESTLNVTLHGCIHQGVSIFQEWEYLTVVFQELDDRLVKTGERFVTLVLARIVHRTTIEHITTAIACRVVRNTFLVSKAHYLYGQLALFQVILELLHFGQFTKHRAKVWIFGVLFAQQLAEVFDGIRHTLDEVRFLFEIATETIGSQHLQGAEKHEVAQLTEEIGSIYRLVFA